MISHSNLPGSLPKPDSYFLVNSTYQAERKPVADVLVRVAGLLAMLAIATALITPPLVGWMPLWKAMVVMIGTVLIYLGASFFIRPQVDHDALEWCRVAKVLDGRANIQRLLFVLHWLLAPGRFAAETLLDGCTLLGLAKGSDPGEDRIETSAPVPSRPFTRMKA